MTGHLRIHCDLQRETFSGNGVSEKVGNTQILRMELRKIIDIGKKMSRPRLDSTQGFLIYVARTYQYFNPYLKGIHLNIYGWRPRRNEEGWKLRTINFMEGCADGKWDMLTQGETLPLYVEVFPQLDKDLESLERLTESKDLLM